MVIAHVANDATASVNTLGSSLTLAFPNTPTNGNVLIVATVKISEYLIEIFNANNIIELFEYAVEYIPNRIWKEFNVTIGIGSEMVQEINQSNQEISSTSKAEGE